MNTPSYLKSILKAVLWDSAFALIPPILLFTMTPGITWARLLEDFQFSWIYSNCIGGIAFFLIPKVWVATCNRPPWLSWSARVAAMRHGRSSRRPVVRRFPVAAHERLLAAIPGLIEVRSLFDD
jgi:hypothetical protein